MSGRGTVAMRPVRTERGKGGRNRQRLKRVQDKDLQQIMLDLLNAEFSFLNRREKAGFIRGLNTGRPISAALLERIPSEIRERIGTFRKPGKGFRKKIKAS